MEIKSHRSHSPSLSEIKRDWKAFSVEQLDYYAWEAICHWHHYCDIDVVHEGIDYSQLTRWYLLDKVARAIRQEIAPEQLAFEVQLITPSSSSSSIKQSSTSTKSKSWQTKLIEYLGNLKNYGNIALNRRQILYIPLLHRHLQQTVSQLVESSLYTVVVPDSQKRLHYHDAYVSPNPLSIEKPDWVYGQQLYQGILQGLQAFNITLLEIDQVTLQKQINEQLKLVKKVEATLNFPKPDAVLLFGDNHPPVQAYVLVAQRDGIETIMLQHGLDCERYYCDQAYAKAIAVWGNARLQRYQHDSTQQPVYLEITGNPEFDERRLPSEIDTTGHYWLWVTRPHHPHKCYAPSRYPNEGLDILAAILEALQTHPEQKLIIKPHRSDYADLYQNLIAKNGLETRVELSKQPIEELFLCARLVISEDSTAGMEGMFWGKVVIHAHFAPSAPVMPFVDYGAALAGFSATMLKDAIRQGLNLTEQQKQQLLQGQQQFIQDFANIGDGKAQTRVLSFINKVMDARKTQQKS